MGSPGGADRQTDIATYRLNLPSGRFSENFNNKNITKIFHKWFGWGEGEERGAHHGGPTLYVRLNPLPLLDLVQFGFSDVPLLVCNKKKQQ